MSKNAKWTFMVYMAAENNLSSNVDKNLDEIEKVGSTPIVNVVGQYDTLDKDETMRFFFENGKMEKRRMDKDTDSGDPKVLTNFIRWAVRKYHADHYALVLHGHGWGWMPGKKDPHKKNLTASKPHRGKTKGMGIDDKTGSSLDTLELGHVIASAKEYIYKKNLTAFKSLLAKTVSRRTREGSSQKRTKGMGIDDKTGSSLDTLELGQVVDAYAKKIIGKKLDILGLDACLMSNLEVAYQVAPFVNYLIASEAPAPPSAWPYDRVLKIFNTQSEDSPADIASAVVNEYINFYKELKNEVNATHSALALEKIEKMAKSVDALGKALLRNMPVSVQEIQTALKEKKDSPFSLDNKTLWDIKKFAIEISKASSRKYIKQAAKRVQKAIEPGLENFVLSEDETGPQFDATWGGLSIYLPKEEKLSDYYKDLTFTKKYPNWHKMLEAYNSNAKEKNKPKN